MMLEFLLTKLFLHQTFPWVIRYIHFCADKVFHGFQNIQAYFSHFPRIIFQFDPWKLVFKPMHIFVLFQQSLKSCLWKQPKLSQLYWISDLFFDFLLSRFQVKNKSVTSYKHFFFLSCQRRKIFSTIFFSSLVWTISNKWSQGSWEQSNVKRRRWYGK